MIISVKAIKLLRFLKSYEEIASNEFKSPPGRINHTRDYSNL
jgi:hypothetical protein